MEQRSRQLSPGGLPAAPHLSPAPTLPTAHHPGSSEHRALAQRPPTTWTQGPGHRQPAASTLHLWTDSDGRPCSCARGRTQRSLSPLAKPAPGYPGWMGACKSNRGSRMLRAGRRCPGAGCGLETFRGRGPSRLRPPRAGETASRENQGRDSRLRPPPGSGPGCAHVPARLPPGRAGLGAGGGPGASRSRGPRGAYSPGRVGRGGRAAPRLRSARRAAGARAGAALGGSQSRARGRPARGQPAGGGGRVGPRGAGTRRTRVRTAPGADRERAGPGGRAGGGGGGGGAGRGRGWGCGRGAEAEAGRGKSHELPEKGAWMDVPRARPPRPLPGTVSPNKGLSARSPRGEPALK